MAIPRGTTPTFTLKFESNNLNLSSANNVYVTFDYGKGKITKNGEDLTIRDDEIDVFLSQEETLNFPVGIVEIQANWTYENGVRCATDCIRYKFSKQLLDEVIG